MFYTKVFACETSKRSTACKNVWLALQFQQIINKWNDMHGVSFKIPE